jgi:hypothetical protein
MSCEDQALSTTKYCTKCGPAFVGDRPIYPHLVKRGLYWCCVACGSSYGENSHPELSSIPSTPQNTGAKG